MKMCEQIDLVIANKLVGNNAKITRKCGSCNALQLEARDITQVILGFNYEARTKFEVG